MPDDMRPQISRFTIIKAHGWPLIVETGVEADDVIGTLAKQAEAANIGVRDLHRRQGISPAVTPHITLKNTMSNENARQKRRIMMAQVRRQTDADSRLPHTDRRHVDNVPGVPKVGPKTAAKWLAEHGSLDTIVAHADKDHRRGWKNLQHAGVVAQGQTTADSEVRS